MIPLHSAATAVYTQISAHAAARSLPPVDWEAAIVEGYAITLRRYGPMFSAWLWPFLFSDASAPMGDLPDNEVVAWLEVQANSWPTWLYLLFCGRAGCNRALLYPRTATASNQGLHHEEGQQP